MIIPLYLALLIDISGAAISFVAMVALGVHGFALASIGFLVAVVAFLLSIYLQRSRASGFSPALAEYSLGFFAVLAAFLLAMAFLSWVLA